MKDNLTDIDIVPVPCPRCGEAQNTSVGGTDPTAETADVSCMVCGYRFEHNEYLRLLAERRAVIGMLKQGQF